MLGQNVLSSLIRNISFIAIFIVLIIVTVAALGATFDLLCCRFRCSFCFIVNRQYYSL